MAETLIHVDLNDCPGDPPDDFVVFVTDYECGSYEGSGQAFGMKADGTTWEWLLGHCSCCGPLDDGPSQYTPTESVLSTGHVPTDLVGRFEIECENWRRLNGQLPSLTPKG